MGTYLVMGLMMAIRRNLRCNRYTSEAVGSVQTSNNLHRNDPLSASSNSAVNACNHSRRTDRKEHSGEARAGAVATLACGVWFVLAAEQETTRRCYIFFIKLSDGDLSRAKHR